MSVLAHIHACMYTHTHTTDNNCYRTHHKLSTIMPHVVYVGKADLFICSN